MKTKLFLIIFLISSIYLRSNGQQSNVAFAKQIIERAKGLTVYVPSENLRQMLSYSLSSLKVLETNPKGKVTFPSELQFVLLIADNSLMSGDLSALPGEKSLTAFELKSEEMLKSGRIIIIMNQDIHSYTSNTDALACVLIHELIHAIQMNERINAGQTKDSKELAYREEKDAWESMIYIYQHAHPEILKTKCNCNTFEVSGDTKKNMDPLIRSMILYQWCRDKFLKTLY